MSSREAALLDAALGPCLLAGAQRLQALAGSRMFVTGATGFFGAWLLRAIACLNAQGAGIELRAASRDPGRFLARFPDLAEAPWLSWHVGDAASFAQAEPLARTRHVLHMAASSDARDWAVDPQACAEAILAGTRGALAVARRSDAHLHLVSSGAVYGPRTRSQGACREADDRHGAPAPHARALAYGNAKRAAESLLALGSDDWSISRPFAFLGPLLPLDQHFAAGNFIADAVAGRAIVVQGDGTPIRSYLHPADLTAWLLLLLANPPLGRAVNIGSDHPLSIGELATRVASIAGSPAPRILGTPQGGDPPAYWPDISHARALGLAPTLSLDDAIRDTLAWARARTP